MLTGSKTVNVETFWIGQVLLLVVLHVGGYAKRDATDFRDVRTRATTDVGHSC